MRLIVTGGGTGGHLFPALAVACGVRRQIIGSEVLFIGTGRQIDAQALADFDFSRKVINFSGVKGLGMSGLLHAASRFPQALIQSLLIIRKFRPDLVFGVGGYVTGPVLLAAKILRVPICIHEQNSVPGLANRLAGRLADAICISLPCNPPFVKKKTVMTGNPVREEILEAASHQKDVSDDFVVTLLVLGGSQGARRVNALIFEAVKILRAEGAEIRIIHQTGINDEEAMRAGYEKIGVRAEVAAFFADMADLYNRADLVVSRAGATTLAELAVMGLPAVLIPFPYAADDHQTTNAGYYVEGGAARMLQERKLSGRKLAGEIDTLLKDRPGLRKMAGAMRSMGRPEATKRILDVCARLIKK